MVYRNEVTMKISLRKLTFILALCAAYYCTNAQSQLTNSGNLQIHSGASVTFFGNLANNGTFTDAGTAVTFKGTAAQEISGSASTSFNNLVEDNAAGVTLQQNVSIGNTLTLTTGPLTLNSRILTISNATSTAIARTNGYIVSEQVNNSGKLTWNIGSNTTAHVFPFGTSAGTYIPFSLTITAGDIGNVTVSTYPTAADNTPYPSAPNAVTNVYRFGIDNSANVVDRFWQIDKDGPSGTAVLSFTATPAEVGSISSLQAQRWNTVTNAWDDPIASQTSAANSATVSDVTSFSPWTLSGNNSPLPITLLSFFANAVNKQAELEWTTASELNNDYYTIQRSQDGLEFSEIGKVPAGKSPKTLQKYKFTDINVFPGKSYYRLKQTDLDGKTEYSQIRMVNFPEFETNLVAYPNPLVKQELSLDFQDLLDKPTTVAIYDIMGKIIYNSVIEPGIRIHAIDLGFSPAGTYIIKTFNPDLGYKHATVIKMAP
jgi:hypothetical protein